MSYRTQETDAAYKKYKEQGCLDRGCPLCEDVPIKTFKYWRIIKNDFPYDLIAKKHHLLVPLRHVVEGQLDKNEVDELKDLKNTYLNTEYNHIIEPLPQYKTIPDHFHLHLVVPKENLDCK